MPSKTSSKKTKTKQPDHSCAPSVAPFDFAALDAREAERAEQRKKERELIISAGVALLAMAEEQRKTFIAQRFESFASALADLSTVGTFPAVEDLRRELLNEMTVLGRELHDSRIAKVQG